MYTFNKFLPLLYGAFLLGFLSHLAVRAQNGDIPQIEQLIDNYITGWRDGNVALLQKTFDMEAGVVLWLDKNGESEHMKSMTLAALAESVKPDPGFGEGYAIQSLEVIDAQLALAVVKVPHRNGEYLDCLELQKIKGTWKIILKSFVFFPNSP